MAFNAGAVEVSLGGKFSPAGFMAFDKAMKKSGNSMGMMDRAILRTTSRGSTALRTLGTAAGFGAAGGIAALGVGLVASVKKAADFESQLSALKSVTQANSREMGLFRTQAMKAGAATKFSALDAAAAQTELAKGGLSVQNIMKGGLRAALSLAAAGDLELADAARFTANAMNLFNINGSQAGHVADALATAANATTADVADFGMALTQGGSAAKAAGLSFDETVTALEALAKIGVKNSDAGTSLKTALVQLDKPTKKAQGVMDDLGLSFFTAQGKMKPLVDISAMLRDKLGGLTQQQRLQAITTLAGTDGMRTLLALYDQGPAKLSSYEAGLKKQGTAAEVAAEKQNNLKGKLENLKGSLETAAIVVGSALIPELSRLAVSFTDWLNGLSASGQLQTFAHGAANALSEIVQAGAQVGVALFGIGQAAVTVAGPVFSLIGALGGIKTVIPVIAGAVAGFYAMRAVAAIVPVIQGLAAAFEVFRVATAVGGVAELAPLLAAAVGPALALQAAFMVLGAGIAYAITQGSMGDVLGKALSEGNKQVAASAREATTALRAQADAMRAVTDAGLAATDANFAARQADLDVITTRKRFAEVTKTAAKGSVEYKQAQLDLQQALARQTAAHVKAGESVQDFSAKITDAEKADRKRISTAQDLVSKLQRQATAEKQVNGELRPETRKRLAAAERDLTNAQAQAGRGAATAQLAQANYARSLQGLGGFTGAAANQIRGLAQSLNQQGKGQTTIQILTNAPSAQAAIKGLTAVVNGIPARKVLQIFHNAPSARAAVLALNAVIRGVPPSKVIHILHNAPSAQSAMRQLQGAINAVPSSHHTTITTTAGAALSAISSLISGINSIPSSHNTNFTTTGTTAPPGTPTGRHASGRGPGGHEAALVGEGDAPEWVVNQRTGARYLTSGPMVVGLGADDFVIPTDPKYAGRSNRLWAAVAEAMGVPGMAQGGAGPAKHPYPKTMALMRRIWGAAGGFFPGAAGMPPTVITPEKAARFGVTSIPAGGVREGREVEWSPQLKLAGKGSNLALENLIHEWAHYFQSPAVAMSKSHWLAEGGAQAFAQIVAPQVYKALGIPYRNVTGGAYDAKAKQAMKAKGRDWVLNGQFLGGGLPEFVKGRAAKKKHKARPIPKKIAFGGIEESALQDLKSRWDSATQRVSTIQGTKKKKGLTAAKAAAKKARDYYLAANREHTKTENLRTDIDSLGDDMSRADKADNQAAYDTAQKARRGKVAALIAEVQKGLKYAPKGTQYARDLRTDLSRLLGTQQDLEDPMQVDQPEPAPEPELLTKAEQGLRDQLEANLALAELTQDTGDDRQALNALAGFWNAILGEEQARGLPQFVTEAAQNLKGVRDQLGDLDRGVSDNADVQAQLDQEKQRRINAEADSRVNAATLAAFQGAGDIGFGRPYINIYTLHPGDPQTLSAIGEAATAGIGFQGSRSSPRQETGI